MTAETYLAWKAQQEGCYESVNGEIRLNFVGPTEPLYQTVVLP